MRLTVLDEERGTARLDESIQSLHRSSPELSAINVLTARQRNVLLGGAAVLVVGAVLNFVATGIFVMAVVTALYIAVTVNRVLLFSRSRRQQTVEVVSDEDALAVPADALPRYTVLIPAYREPEVIQTLLDHVDRLDYPRDKLDVKVLLEADDGATIEAVAAADPPDYVHVVLVPPAEPRTKPKALNYGLNLSDGEIVTIYDAEDEPEPLQLRRAAVALDRAGPKTVCVQAKLSFANLDQNIITRWFTIEYAMWFAFFLPGLVSVGAPLPLGGTSNHFRRDVLEQLGAWDPHNVTEDADLGIRLARHGYRCAVLESTTFEEANSDFVNWVKQRSRWYKGYLQTSVIHLRRPVALWRDLGSRGVAELVLFVLGTPLLAMLNTVFWLLTAWWFMAHPHIIQELFPAPLFYPAVLCWVFGNFVVAFLTVLTVRLTQRFELIWAALLVPLYWVMMAIAAIKAVWQLVATPTFWEKTTHGLHVSGRPPGSPAPATTPAARRNAPAA